MKHTKDLNWLGAPAFFLIIGMILLSAKKQNANRHPEKIKVETAVSFNQK